MANDNNRDRKPLPTPEEIDVMVLEEFPEASGQCVHLCDELETTLEELENVHLSPAQRRQLLVRLAAINYQRRNLHCPNCYPQ